MNHSTGDFYVADRGNHRVQQFAADGVFVRAWGFDVDSANPGTGFEVCAVAADCKAGVNGAAAGQVGSPYGVAVDQSNGFVYVASQANRRIDVFSASGQFAGAFGWDVDPAGIVGLEVCTTGSGCKAPGAAGGAAGQLGNPFVSWLGIDPSGPAGTVYVPDYANARVAKYKAEVSGGVLQSASFVKAFGWDVAPGAVDEEQEIRVRATAGQFTLSFGGDTTADLDHDATAGEVEAALNALPSVSTGGGSVTVTGGPGDETGSDLYVVRFSGGPLAGTDVAQLTAANGTTPLGGGDPSSTATVQTRAQGGTSTELESCTTASGCKAGITGNGSGQFTGSSPAAQSGSPRGAAVDSTGAVYVTSGPLFNGNNSCSVAFPCRIQKFDPSTTTAVDFGPLSGDGLLTQTAGTVGTVAGLDVAVDPADDHVLVNQKTDTTSYVVREYTETGDLVDTHPTGGLTGSNLTPLNGIAAGTDERVYTNAIGTSVYILGNVPDPTPTIGAVTDVTASKATFSGSVEIPAPGAPTFSTGYRFEYSSNGVDWVKAPDPDQQPGDGTTGIHPVSHVVGGLQPNTLYQVRLVASTGNDPVVSATTSFTTSASAPRVAMTYVDEVTQTSARLGAHIDPEGLSASYHFEWGTEPCSDVPNPCASVPATDRQLGNGDTIVVATENLDNLAEATTHHYRVVVTNSDDDTTIGPVQTFETLNDCGLPDGRCYEMVSQPDKGPLGSATGSAAFADFTFKAAADGPGAAYTIAYGASDATSGSDPLYQATRGESAWTSGQLTPPTVRPHTGARIDDGQPMWMMGMASDLSCSFLASREQLAADAPVEVLDAGGYLLYRRNSDGSWTTVTDQPVLNTEDIRGRLSANQYRAVGISDEPGNRCGRVIFYSPFHYAGAAGAGDFRLYEWNDGVLSSVGVVPGPGGPVAVPVRPGAYTGAPTSPVNGVELHNFSGAVSRGGTRVVFQAQRQASPEPAEVSKLAVFVRDSGDPAGTDVSLSQTVVANDGPSRYEVASADGGQVFFTARHGLAGNSGVGGPATCQVGGGGSGGEMNAPNREGCDLYRYSVADGALASVTGATSNATGASVAGVLDVSEDGSHAYFAARGQLIPGEGKTETANLADNTYSVYLSTGGSPTSQPDLRYVGTLGRESGSGFLFEDALVNARTMTNKWTWAQRISTDGRRMMFPSAGNVDGDGGGAVVEAYLYDADADRTVCLSCRRDRQPSMSIANFSPVPKSGSRGFSPPVALTADGRRAFFTSSNRLAPGAVEGVFNAYMWEEGQVSLIAPNAIYKGASQDGNEAYFQTQDRLTWQDIDDKADVYVARVGGGIAAPPSGPDPCDPLAAGSCADGAAGAPAAPSVDSSVPRDRDVDPGARAVFSVAGLSRAQRSRLAAGRRVGVVVRVSRPGRVSVRGTARIAGLRARVLSGVLVAKRAGRYRVPVVLSRPAVKRLRRAGRLRVAVAVRFAGARSVAVRRIGLSRPKAGRKVNNDRRASR